MLTHTRVLLVATLVILALTTKGLGSASPPASGPGSELTHEQGDYRIGLEDVLKISVWKNEALSVTVPVRPDGKISLPLLKEIQAAGLTPMELREALVEKLAEYLPTPQVSVIVSEIHSYKVSVIGEVKRPGRYEIKSRTTVLDMLAQAEGMTEFASRSRIFILRPNGTSMQRIPFNYNKAINADSQEEILYVQPRDIVIVP